MHKGLPLSHSLLQGEVQNGSDFPRTKFRVNEVLRGPVEPQVLVTQFKPGIEVMNLFVGQMEPLHGFVGWL